MTRHAALGVGEDDADRWCVPVRRENPNPSVTSSYMTGRA